MSAKRVYGIDLGTTYSCIAHVDDHGRPVVLPNAEGELTTPSVVYFESERNVVVGQAAKEVSAFHHAHCVSTVKRAMGDPHWQRSFFSRDYTPQDISSFILRKVVSDAERITGDTIEYVVITCPAYFGVNEKEATKQAGEVAGLNVLYVIPEPTAAALAYGVEQEDDQVILVYDLGGGTFDVTIIQTSKDEINVICTGGDHQLGGKDWDDAIVSFFAERFAEETGVDADALVEDQETYQELLNAAERCKRGLSTRESYEESVRFEASRARIKVTRQDFESLTANLLERTLSLTEQEIEKAKAKGIERIDKLLLVGGSTYMPQVVEAVGERFPLEVQQYDPNQAVAKGAAIFGYKCYLDEQIKIRVAEKTGEAVDEIDLEDLDDDARDAATKEVAREHGLAPEGLKDLVDKKIGNVSSKSFGIIVVDRQRGEEIVANLIESNEPVPCELSQRFSTLEENQVRVNLRCMESNLAVAEAELTDCVPIGEAVLAFASALPQGSPVEVTFALGADGLLKLHGKDLTTGGEVDADFKTESIMGPEEAADAKRHNLTLEVA